MKSTDLLVFYCSLVILQFSLIGASASCGSSQYPCTPTKLVALSSPIASPTPNPKNNTNNINNNINSNLHHNANPNTNNEYKLVWSDEFNYPHINRSKWSFDTGTGHNGWGNNELQWYLSKNAKIVDGSLEITARKQFHRGSHYTSARLHTKNKFEFIYGKIESRIKLPIGGNGIWSAFWLLGSNINRVSWPECGEIDILEHIGNKAHTIDASLHGPGYSGGKNGILGIGNEYTNNLINFENEYHIYTLEWNNNTIIWYIDNNIIYSKVNKNDIILNIENSKWVFNNHPFFIILNLAIGGEWAHKPNKHTKFPQRLYIDYIRVYQT